MLVTDFCSAPKIGFRGYVKCGKCKGCLRLRQNDWVRRAMMEFEAHDRTWFLTLTYRGEFEVGYDAVQKFLKRLRKNTGHKIRFLCATERGSKNDRLHYHLCIHGPLALTKRLIIKEWPHGLTHMRLMKDLTAARYVAKYTAKDGKLRASLGYGYSTLDAATEKLKEKSDVLQAVLHAFPDARIDRIARKPIPYRLRLRRSAGLLADHGRPDGRLLGGMQSAATVSEGDYATALLHAIDYGLLDRWGRSPLNPWHGVPPATEEGLGDDLPETLS